MENDDFMKNKINTNTARFHSDMEAEKLGPTKPKNRMEKGGRQNLG
jgi:hypothetical protein